MGEVVVQLPTVPTKEAAREAADAWGFNCGPGAFCAVTGVSAFGSISFFPPQEMGGDWPGYTNPTYMAKALRKYGLTWREVYRGDVEVAADRLPTIEPPRPRGHPPPVGRLVDQSGRPHGRAVSSNALDRRKR